MSEPIEEAPLHDELAQRFIRDQIEQGRVFRRWMQDTMMMRSKLCRNGAEDESTTPGSGLETAHRSGTENP